MYEATTSTVSATSANAWNGNAGTELLEVGELVVVTDVNDVEG